MKRKLSPAVLLGPISALQKLMDTIGCPWTIIGGVASSLLGKPRFTADVDAVVLVEPGALSSIIKNARKLGLEPRINGAEAFAEKNRVLLLKHKGSGINIDLSLGLLPFEEQAVKKSKKHKIGDISFYLPTVEDLIIFKAVAHRPQDMLDINELVRSHKKIDKKYIKKVVSEFAHILETPEILSDLKKILQ